MFNDYFDSVVCMNLKSREDRKSKCDEVFATVNTTVTYVESISSNSVQDAETGLALPYQALNKTLINVLTDAIDNNVQKLLIFEDDIDFTQDAQTVFEAAKDQLPEDWDVLYLGFRSTTARNPVISENLRKVRYAYLGHAMAVSANIMPAWKERLEALDLESDLCLSEIYKDLQNYKAYATYPGICYQRPGYSNTLHMVTDNSEIH